MDFILNTLSEQIEKENERQGKIVTAFNKNYPVGSLLELNGAILNTVSEAHIYTYRNRDLAVVGLSGLFDPVPLVHLRPVLEGGTPEYEITGN
jgi:hypothetical protein